MTGDELKADEAYRLGLVQAVLRSARIARVEGQKAALARLYPDIGPIMTSEDAAEGVQAFLERREAVFKGR